MPKIPLRGSSQEDNFWDFSLPISSPPTAPIAPLHVTSPSSELPLENTSSFEPMMPSNINNNLQLSGESQQQLELRVYSL